METGITMKTTITSTAIFTTDIAQTEIVNTDISSNIITTKGETGSISFKFRFTTKYLLFASTFSTTLCILPELFLYRPIHDS